jgi:hypothetical protein
MFLFYYDEVKYHPPKQSSFWLGGVAVEASAALSVENKVNEVSEDAFGSRILDRGKEFHGQKLVQGNGCFKGVSVEQRAEFLGRLLKIAADESVLRFFVKVNPENFVATSDSPDEIAFMFLVEQINCYLTKKQSYGLLLGDYDEPVIGGSVISLSKFKASGTYWSKATTVDRIVDTVHFAKSHHSRMIQLADIYLYCRQFHKYDADAPWRKKFNECIQNSGILASSFSKIWPQEKVWYRS